MRQTVLLAGPDLAKLFSLAMQLGTAVAPTVIETYRPVESLIEHPAHVDAAVVYLLGSENVSDLRQLMESHACTRFLFLAPSFPPRAAIARVVSEHGGAILPQEESSLVIAATIVAMHTRAKGASVS